MRRLTCLVLFAALGLLVAGSAGALHIPGATYSGTHSAGGTVAFTISPDGFEVTSFSFERLPLGCGTYLTGDRDVSVPITNDTFSYTAQGEGDISFSGTFTGVQSATGTLSWSGSFCAGNHPTVTWNASTSSPPEADLSVTATALADSVLVGDQITYRVTVANDAGPATALTPTLTATLPPGVTFVSGAESNGLAPCSSAGSVVTCPLLSIPAGGSGVVDVDVTASRVGRTTVSFGVASQSPDPSSTNNTASVQTTVQAPCIVPNVKGRLLPAARRALARARCKAGEVTRRYSRKVEKGRVVSQDEAPGTRLDPGTSVDLVVSRGRRR
jgi:uncharacterized repeat protein (TIGR01451 family)